MSKLRNSNIPDAVIRDCIISDLRRKVGELTSEVQHLQAELSKRDNAIAAFKKWQKRIVDYKWQYWYTEAIKLTDRIPDEETHNAVRSMMLNFSGYEKMANKFDARYKAMVAAAEILKKNKETT